MNQQPYYEISGLENVYLEDSYVLNIIENDNQIVFDLELVILEGHPSYSDPIANQMYCYRNARLEFNHATKIDWLEKHLVTYSDADDKHDFGNIDVLWKNANLYHIEGDWGILNVESDNPILRIRHISQV